jgi:hypothetical protein
MRGMFNREVDGVFDMNQVMKQQLIVMCRGVSKVGR